MHVLMLKTLRTEKVITKTFGQNETSVVQKLDVVPKIFPNIPVGILIGIDYYHTFKTGKLITPPAVGEVEF